MDQDRTRYPEIETARLPLRPLTPEVLGAIHHIWMDPDVRRYLWDDERISRERADSVLAVSIESFESRTFGLWGVGLATEAARASIRYGLEETGFDRILGIADTVNEASRCVLEKAGMRFEKHAIYEDRKETRYEISRKEFQPDDAPYTLRRA